MNKQEIQQECKDLFDEIEQLRDILKWTQKMLFEKTFVEIDEDGSSKVEKRFIEATKKIFQRKNWTQEKATDKTLKKLKQLREAIYCCEDYKKSKLHDSKIPLEIRKNIQKESKKLEKYLKMTHRE